MALHSIPYDPCTLPVRHGDIRISPQALLWKVQIAAYKKLELEESLK